MWLTNHCEDLFAAHIITEITLKQRKRYKWNAIRAIRVGTIEKNGMSMQFYFNEFLNMKYIRSVYKFLIYSHSTHDMVTVDIEGSACVKILSSVK